jgi:hypothetical protein
LVVEIQKGILLYSCHTVRKFLNIDTEHNKIQQSQNVEVRRPVIMLNSTALLLDSNIRNSVCTPAKLPCRRVVEGSEFFFFFYKKHITRDPATNNGSCGICESPRETTQHIISSCSVLA